MDHLGRTGANGVNLPITVPFLCLQEYKKGDFHSYPTRRLFDPDIVESKEIGWTDKSGYSLRERTGLFQEWLFFGGLTEVFGTVGLSITTYDFVQGGLVSTEKLAGYVINFASKLDKLSGDHKIAATGRIEACLTTVRHYAQFRPAGKIIKSLAVCPERLPIALSITVLFESLTLLPLVPWSDEYMAGLQKERLTLAGGLMMANTSTTNFMETILMSRMRYAGWCPNQIAGFPTMDASFAYYLGMMSPIKRSDHGGCSANFCACNQLNDDYTTKHCSSCDSQKCEIFSVELRGLESIIEKGDIPVIQLKQQSGSGFSIEVLSREPQKNYIALSHVWSHGLGNPEGNALPTCQIIRIWNLINQFDPSTGEAGFWIDTICVPISGLCRKLSIQRMGSIYSEAAAVLVLDDELQKTGTDPIEQVVRLSSSTWQRRLWTLQEACLNSESLFIQFLDGAIGYQTLIRTAMEHPSIHALEHPSSLISTVPGKAIDPIAYIGFMGNYRFALATDTSFGDEESASSAIFLFLLETLSWRTTTKASDEPICIATILGIDTAPLLEVSSSEERMKLFLRSLPRVPDDLLFFSGPKLSHSDGLGWASKSFLEKNGHPFARYKWTSPTPSGLPIVADGAVLSLSHTSATDKECREEELDNGRTGMALQDIFSTPQNVVALGNPPVLFLLHDCTVTGADHPPINLLDIPDPALIFREEADQLFRKDSTRFACLVSLNRAISSISDTTIQADFRSLVSLEEVESKSMAFEDVAAKCCFTAIQLRLLQRWIVG